MRSDRPPADPDPEAEADDLDAEDADAPEHLDPDVVQDGDATSAVIGRWVRGDADARRRQREIEHLLGVVRARADCQVWDLVLRVLALQRGRGEDLGLLLATRAFHDGQRHPVVARDGGDGRDERDDRDGGDDRDGLPALTPAVLADAALLGIVTEAVLSADSGLSDISEQIRRAWARVRDRVDDRTWRRVLAAEELLNHRAATAQEILMAFAYRAGSRRSPGGSR
jgi:hypothetical protein